MRRKTNSDLSMARFRFEQQYLANVMQGLHRKKKKDPQQMEALLRHFDEKPIWDYAKKIAICEELEMTMAQVQKWNWDQRQKVGLLSKKKQDAKKNQL